MQSSKKLLTLLFLSFFVVGIISSLLNENQISETSIDQNMNKNLESELDESFVISKYDAIMQEVAGQNNQDWRLLSAIAYHESRFTEDIKSPKGAAGLMQVMPAIARKFNVTESEMMDPKTNIELASQLITAIENSLKIKGGTSNDRTSITLACYVAGIGHVTDARRLARKYGEDSNSWSVVEKYLKLKSTEEYYQDEVVKCGKFMGGNTTSKYVNNVMSRYDKYCRLATL